MIVHFASQNTADIFAGKIIRRVPVSLQENALRKLRLMDAATSIASLQAVPSLRCKVLGGQPKNRPALWSIRVNDQWRITFTCTEPPLKISNVEFSDYH